MKTRLIHTKMFSDEYYLSLNPIEKCVFQTLLFNDKVGLSDIYELPEIILSMYTGLPIADLKPIKDKFEKDRKFRFYKSYVQIVNSSKYQQFTGEKNEIARRQEVNYLPEEIKKHFSDTLSGIQEYPIGGEEIDYLPSGDSLSNHKPITNNQKTEIINPKSEKEIVKRKQEAMRPKDSKNSLEPCTEEELQEIADSIGVDIENVRDTHESFQEQREAGELSRKTKTCYLTVKKWVRLDLKRGYIKRVVKEAPPIDTARTNHLIEREKHFKLMELLEGDKGKEKYAGG